MDFAGANTNFTIPGSGQAAPFTPGGTSPFTPGGFDPLSNKVSGIITDLDRSIYNGSVGRIPGFDIAPTNEAAASGLTDSVKGLFADSTIGGLFARFGLEIIGLIFIVFGFLMLAMRGGEGLASSEVGRTAAAIIK